MAACPGARGSARLMGPPWPLLLSAVAAILHFTPHAGRTPHHIFWLSADVGVADVASKPHRAEQAGENARGEPELIWRNMLLCV